MPISVRLDRALESRLNHVSEKLRVNKSEIIKRSLEAFLEQFDQPPSAYELGEDLFGADRSPGKAVAADYKKILKEKLRAKHPG
jgi:predicted transcriptional regulator